MEMMCPCILQAPMLHHLFKDTLFAGEAGKVPPSQIILNHVNNYTE